jgi:hypothetical protein
MWVSGSHDEFTVAADINIGSPCYWGDSYSLSPSVNIRFFKRLSITKPATSKSRSASSIGLKNTEQPFHHHH